MRRHLLAVVVVVWAAAGCTKINPNYCADAAGHACSNLDAGIDVPMVVDATDATDVSEGGDASHDATEAPAERPTCTNASCTTDVAPICDVDAGMCEPCATNDECAKKSPQTPACDKGHCYACVTDDQCSNATMPICDGHACRACDINADCASKTATPACAPSGKCVECAVSADCGGTKPVCNTTANTCRACASDAECPADPGVCMADGHCAGTSEVIFVDGAASCAMADGTSGKPYCAPNDGVAHLAVGRNVIVLRGNSSSQMALATTGVSPVIIGRTNASSVAGSVPAVASTGITISSDTVLVRDLTVNVGTGTSSKGIAATGASTKVTLLRVTVSLGTGLGVDAEAGASLTMDECYVLNNSAGGILINGASYSIQNTVVAGNGFTGVQFTASTVSTGSQFWFNTVIAGTSASAATCDPSNPQILSDSIVAGGSNCSLPSSTATAPTFDAAKPFHLTTKLACPSPAPTTSPGHDIDGDARVSPFDCGADQFHP